MYLKIPLVTLFGNNHDAIIEINHSQLLLGPGGTTQLITLILYKLRGPVTKMALNGSM